jgi:hypothetical protein
MQIMDMFRSMVGANPAAMPQPNGNPAAQGQQPGAVQLPNQQAPANVGADPANPNFGQPDPKQEKSPLEDFSKLWTIDPKTDGQQQASLGDFAFSVDQAAIKKATQGIDFTKAITPEILAKVQAGGEGAMAAMLSAMNTMAQEAVRNSVLVSAGIVEGGIKSSGANTEKLLPSLVRKSNISNALREDNPLFNNPATAPMLNMLEGQLTRKFPNATPAEITEHARKYLVDFAKVASGLDPEVANAQKAEAAKTPNISDFSTWDV